MPEQQQTKIQEARYRIAEWRWDPVVMVRSEFGVEPDVWQAKALRAFARQDSMRLRMALQACVGPGKTACLAWMAWNFIACYCGPEGRHPSGICISESWDNLRDNLWKELAVWQSRSSLLSQAFELGAERLVQREHPKTWFLAARSWPRKADQAAQGRTLSGLHSDFIAYFIDESGDIPPSVLKSAEQGLSNCRWGRIVQAGNPSSHDGMLYHAVTVQPHMWDVVRITGDPDDPERSPRIGLEWATEQVNLYGRNDPWVMYAVLGQFPPTAVNALLGPDDLAAAMGRHVTSDKYSFMQKRIGIDPARFGDDRTVLFPRQGLAGHNFIEMRNADGPSVAGRLMLGKQKFGSELELIDDTGGYGASIIDACKLAGVNLMPVNFSAKADDPRYYNKRAEMNFRAAEWVKAGGVLPNSPQLAREAVAIRYWFEKGKFRVIEKDQIKKQLNGHSPDIWDALCLTFAIVDMPARGMTIGGESLEGPVKKVLSEYDPFASVA